MEKRKEKKKRAWYIIVSFIEQISLFLSKLMINGEVSSYLEIYLLLLIKTAKEDDNIFTVGKIISEFHYWRNVPWNVTSYRRLIRCWIRSEIPQRLLKAEIIKQLKWNKN